MTSIRRIPITVAPLPGEALDSWLEALAHATHTCWADLLEAIGMGRGCVDRAMPGWMLHPTAEHRSKLQAATGIDASAIQAMTLAGHCVAAPHMGAGGARRTQTFPWGPRAGSLYCPHCLAQSQGRWSLAWRLGWTFACLKHRCLLAAGCPTCGSRPRVRPRSGQLIPHPGHCAEPAMFPSTAPRCDTDLATATVVAFDRDDHPVLRAQRWVNAVLAGDRPSTGIYRERPEPGVEILYVVRMLAVKVLRYVTPAELERLQIPAELLTVYRRDHPQLPTETQPSGSRELTIGVPRHPSLTAIGILAALACLNQPDIPEAGRATRWLIDAMRARGARTSTIDRPWPDGLPRAVQLSALHPDLKPSEQLRFRSATRWPSSPAMTPTMAQERARKIPTLLWQNHSLRLAVPGSHHRQLRSALAAALLLVGASGTLSQRVQLLDSPIGAHGISRILQLLHYHPAWPDICAALIALADDLDAENVPIDYQRRRNLDYATLLPDQGWLRICRQTDTAARGPARAAVARHYLHERISGAPGAALSAETRTKIADFPYYLTPELADALDTHAKEFLASHLIDDEPVHYEHPTAGWRGLRLPGSNPDLVDIEVLHLHVRAGLPLGQAATAAGTDLDVARYLLACYPTPVLADAEPGAYYRAKHSYPRQKLIDLYQTQGRSLRDIADAAGVSKQTITRLAADYRIDLRKPGRETKYDIDRDWLYTEYITRSRPLPELARERGVGTTTVARWANKYGIPLRPRGGARNGGGRGSEVETG